MVKTRRRARWAFVLMIIVIAVVAGCDSDKRLVELSRESLDRQANQNATMARQNQAVTETTRELIKAQTEVQSDANQQQQQLHAERSTLDHQRQNLEDERRSLAGQRQRDPIIAESIKGGILVVVAALPLVVCLYLARSLFLSTSDDVAAAEVLIEGLAILQPRLEGNSGLCLPSEVRNNIVRADRGVTDVPRLPASFGSPDSENKNNLRVVMVVEGAHDVEFLKRISRIVSQDDPSLPDLAQWETAGQIVFVPNNGLSTSFRTDLTGQGLAEFHLLDRETVPTTAQRQAAALAINSRPHCRAVLTSKRSIENYLHPAAIQEVCGVLVTVDDISDVAEVIARALFQRAEVQPWDSLSRRARRRLRDKTKRWLNRDAVDHMTPERLAERDPQGEVRGWLRTITELTGHPATPA